MRKKIKCKVCGLRLEPKRERTVPIKSGGIFDTTIAHYDVMDCPRCGCEITLDIRRGATPPAKLSEREESEDE